MTVWPQFTLLGLLVLGFGCNLSDFGRPKTGTHGLTELVVAPAITLAILYYGGFFTSLGFAP